jgi:uncharacterized protein YjbI with pentapeptide repeats
MEERKDTPAPEEGNEAPTQDQIPQSKPWTLRKFGGKTVWDWMDLLMVPIMLSLITVVFAWQQDARQQRIEEQRAESALTIQQQNAQDEALQAYLDQMTQLILDRKLLEAEEGDSVYTMAQARTSTVITRLDADHNRNVTRFLRDSGLLGEFVWIDFRASSINLFRRIDLSDADLRGADLSNADLLEANLRSADLSDADLSDANLRSANLRFSNLRSADLSDADLRSANLSNAYLSDATLTSADLSDAKASKEQLDQANSLEGATMPDGSIHP